MRFRGFSERYLFWQNEEKKKSVSAHIGGGTSQPVRDLACPACPLGGGALRSTVKPEKSQIEHFFFFSTSGKEEGADGLKHTWSLLTLEGGSS